MCECKRDMMAAAAELAESSRFLSRSISSDCDDLIEMYYASFRASKSKFCGAMAAYRDQQAMCEEARTETCFHTQHKG